MLPVRATIRSSAGRFARAARRPCPPSDRHYRAKLVAQHIVELWRYPYADYAACAGDYQEFCRALREGGKEQLQEFVKIHTHDEIQPELVVHQGAAPDCI